MAKTYKTCEECGARLDEGAVQCDLCGSFVETPETAEAELVAEPETPGLPVEAEAMAESEATAGSAEDAAPAQPADRPAIPAGVFCNQCGWKNPPGARFCSKCGAALQVIDDPAPTAAPVASVAAPVPAQSEEKAPKISESAPKAASSGMDQKAMSRQVGIIVGAGVLLVVALFLVTAVSKTQPAGGPDPAAQQAMPAPPAPEQTPLPPQLNEQVATIEDEMAGLTGAARVARQRDLIALFFSAGRLDRAALEQQKIAEATGAVDDWKRVGDLFYDWMNTIPDPPRKAQVASQAVAAYQTVLAQDPDNLDVRTDMATAYLNTGSPMQGVTEIKRVLEADSTHLHARFNYGLMLTWINRPDQAIEQFEQVKALVDESSDYYRRADEAIRVIRQGGNL